MLLSYIVKRTCGGNHHGPQDSKGPREGRERAWDTFAAIKARWHVLSACDGQHFCCAGGALMKRANMAAKNVADVYTYQTTAVEPNDRRAMPYRGGSLFHPEA